FRRLLSRFALSAQPGTFASRLEAGEYPRHSRGNSETFGFWITRFGHPRLLAARGQGRSVRCAERLLQFRIGFPRIPRRENRRPGLLWGLAGPAQEGRSVGAAALRIEPDQVFEPPRLTSVSALARRGDPNDPCESPVGDASGGRTVSHLGRR